MPISGLRVDVAFHDGSTVTTQPSNQLGKIVLTIDCGVSKMKVLSSKYLKWLRYYVEDNVVCLLLMLDISYLLLFCSIRTQWFKLIFKKLTCFSLRNVWTFPTQFWQMHLQTCVCPKQTSLVVTTSRLNTIISSLLMQVIKWWSSQCQNLTPKIRVLNFPLWNRNKFFF